MERIIQDLRNCNVPAELLSQLETAEQLVAKLEKDTKAEDQAWQAKLKSYRVALKTQQNPPEPPKPALPADDKDPCKWGPTPQEKLQQEKQAAEDKEQWQLQMEHEAAQAVKDSGAELQAHFDLEQLLRDQLSEALSQQTTIVRQLELMQPLECRYLREKIEQRQKAQQRVKERIDKKRQDKMRRQLLPPRRHGSSSGCIRL